MRQQINFQQDSWKIRGFGLLGPIVHFGTSRGQELFLGQSCCAACYGVISAPLFHLSLAAPGMPRLAAYQEGRTCCLVADESVLGESFSWMGIEMRMGLVSQCAHLNMQFLLLPALRLDLLLRALSRGIHRHRWKFRVYLLVLEGFQF